MKRTLLGIPLAVLLATGAALVTGCYASSASVGVTAGDPYYGDAYVVRNGHVWVEGHWVWQGDQWVWAPGYWVVDRPGYVYTQGYWHYDSYWRWYPGSWVVARPGYVYSRGYWDTRGGRRVWVRGDWTRSNTRASISGGRWTRSGGTPNYRRGPAVTRDHRHRPPPAPRRRR
jgi:hypothetical protein